MMPIADGRLAAASDESTVLELGRGAETGFWLTRPRLRDHVCQVPEPSPRPKMSAGTVQGVTLKLASPPRAVMPKMLKAASALTARGKPSSSYTESVNACTGPSVSTTFAGSAA